MYEEIPLRYVYPIVPVLSHIALFIIFVMFGYYLSTGCMRYRIHFEFPYFYVSFVRLMLGCLFIFSLV